MTETRPHTTQIERAANPLDQAWELTNAEGGAPGNEYERGFNDGIGKALEVIERLGGMNPAIRNASPAVQRAYGVFREQSAKYDAEKRGTA